MKIEEDTPVQGLDYLKLLKGIWRRRKLILLGVFSLLVAPLLIVAYYTTPPYYVSTATLAVETTPMELIPQVRELSSRQTNIRSAVSTLIVHLKSRSLSAAVADALPLHSLEELNTNPQYTDYLLKLSNMVKGWFGTPPAILTPRQRAIAEMQEARMDFRPSQDPDGVLYLQATASTPRTATDLVSTYIQVLTDRTRGADAEDAQKVRAFLEAQAEQVKQSLAKAEQNIAQFQEKKGRLKFGAQNEFDLARLSQLESALAEAQAGREVVSVRIAKLRKSLGYAQTEEKKRLMEKQAGEESRTSPGLSKTFPRVISYAQAQERLARLRAKLDDLRERYTEAHPLVEKTEEEVTQYQALVAQLARNLPPSGRERESGTALSVEEAEKQLVALVSEETALQAKADTLSIQLDRLRNSLRTLGGDEVRFRDLHRSVEMDRNLMAILSDKLMGARIRERGDLGVFRIIDSPSFPIEPSRSTTYKRMLVFMALSAGVAFGIALGLEFWTLPIERASDVQRATGLPVLGSVGIIESQGTARNRSHTSRRTLPVHLQGSSWTALVNLELYRAIRASVESERVRKAFHSMMICSAWPAEGKSSSVINIAHAFQALGRRVLIIDSDLRRPSLHLALSVGNKPGIVDFLLNNAPLESVCRLLPSGVTMISGQVTKQDPGALLTSPRLHELLRFGRDSFDLVIFDSAPLLAVADNLLLPGQVDKVVIVVKSATTSSRDLQKVHSILERQNASILGVILNQVEKGAIDYYHPRYRKYYRTDNVKPNVKA